MTVHGMMKLMRGAVVVAAVVMCGCVAAPATALTVGMAAAETGSAYYTRGELRAALEHDFDGVVEAARGAIEQLDFVMVRTTEQDGFVYLLTEDENGRRLSIRVTRRTSRLTTTRIRYGVIADRHVAAVVYETMLHRMGELDVPPRHSSG